MTEFTHAEAIIVNNSANDVLLAVRRSAANVRRECAEVVALCCHAGQPQMAGEFILAGLDAASVKRRLAAPVPQPVKQPVKQPGGRQQPSANGAAFNLAAIEEAARASKRLQ